MNYAQHARQQRRKGCRRNRTQRGGEGMAYTFGASVDPQNPGLGNAAEVIRFPSCENAVRPGYDMNAQIRGGLPGFAGGRRRIRRSRRSNAQMMGGRYTIMPEVVGEAGIAITNPQYSGCGEGASNQANPINQPPYNFQSQLTAPAASVSDPTPFRQSGGVGGVDSMVYEAPRAGYTQWPSDTTGGNAGTLADGKTPFEVNVPYSAQPSASAACIKTGGRRSGRQARRARTASKSRKSRKSRKSHRASRKSHRASRKHRKTRRRRN